MEVDYIVVGQGLMGSCLAAELEARAQRVLLFDEDAKWAASPFAVGMYHPLSGRGMRPTWQASLIFDTLEAWYRRLEERWSARFLYPMPVYRPFLSLEEALSFAPSTDTSNYLSSYATKPLYRLGYEEMKGLRDSFGGLMVKKSGQLDVASLLLTVRKRWSRRGLFRQASFRYEDCVLPEKGGILYNGLRAKAVISCEGIGLMRNPFFRSLPLRPLAGEWLEASSNEAFPIIVNRKKYIVPRPRGQNLRIGSTYEHIDADASVSPTKSGQAGLLRGYHALCRGGIRRCGAAAAVRPSTIDRRPWVGVHPRYPAMGVCNGLGTKGVSLAPYLAERMADFLLEGAQPPQASALLRKHGLCL